MTTGDRIVEVAYQLFYQQGYEHTTFADIADIVQISRGNFYYHFKSKEEILDAVIKLRLANTCEMLERWESSGENAGDRIESFIGILIENQTKIMAFGCPVGTLTSELAKLNHTSQPPVNSLFTLFRSWLSEQFILLGHEADADKLAMHILARSQGVAMLANAFHDEKFIREEVEQMCSWLRSLTPGGAGGAKLN